MEAYRINGVITSVRPKTLNVNNRRESSTIEAKYFICEALNAWRAKARCNVVPATRVQELFHELQFNPSERQISQMLQTAKMFARKGSRQWNGLTFGEFCVLAADLKRFRTASLTTLCEKSDIHNIDYDNDVKTENFRTPSTSSKRTHQSRRKSTKPIDVSKKSNIENPSSSFDNGAPVEVFLGGSCNPTTWRKDVAIPALEKLGISFYNPQVSDWTPDLIELEHRAKEKARVLFFVMDSETRASAGAIEAAHIAGQNCKQLVLVLHPYKPDQYILNEPISNQEYIDLMRNQQMLQELVTRRGLPVLDNIPSGLQRTKDILAGIKNPPSNIASILIVVRGAFDRVSAMKYKISLEQCQRALLMLGYAQSLLTLESLEGVINFYKELFKLPSESTSLSNINGIKIGKVPSIEHESKKTIQVDFEQFCILAAFLSVLQQEIHESGCISPIKGTNVLPPPVYLSNLQGFHSRLEDESFISTYSYSKHIFRTNGCTSVPSKSLQCDKKQIRDNENSPSQSMRTVETKNNTPKENSSKSHVRTNLFMTFSGNENETEDNSNDDSSDTSTNLYHCSDDSVFSSFEIRDVYLGGSCYLRSRWRQDYAIPYLKSKQITFHLPALHESIQQQQLDLHDAAFEDLNSQKMKQEEKVIPKHLVERNNVLHSSDVLKDEFIQKESTCTPLNIGSNLYNPILLDSSRVLLFVITNETRSLAPMTLAAHSIGLMYNVILCVQMLPENCIIGKEKLTPTAIKDYNRGRSYLIDLAKRQGVPVFDDLKSALECTLEKIKAFQFQKKSQKDVNSDQTPINSNV